MKQTDSKRASGKKSMCHNFAGTDSNSPVKI